MSQRYARSLVWVSDHAHAQGLRISLALPRNSGEGVARTKFLRLQRPQHLVGLLQEAGRMGTPGNADGRPAALRLGVMDAFPMDSLVSRWIRKHVTASPRCVGAVGRARFRSRRFAGATRHHGPMGSLDQVEPGHGQPANELALLTVVKYTFKAAERDAGQVLQDGFDDVDRVDPPRAAAGGCKDHDTLTAP